MRPMSRQLVMFRRAAALATLGHGYVPILLVKRGEREALTHLAADTWLGLTPWLRIVPPELRSGREDVPPEAEMARLGRIIGDRAVYLDPAGTPRRGRRVDLLGPDYVQQHLEAAVAGGLAFAPVYPFSRPDLSASIAAFADDELGAAVSLSADATLTWGARNLVDEIRREVQLLEVDPSQLDLLIDLGYIREGAGDPPSVLWLARRAIAAAPWRSVVLAGTAVPDSLADEIPDDSLNGIERRERSLFDAVQAQLAVRLRFADYAVQHPIPPARGAVPRMRASIRYTSGDHLFVSRGGRPMGELARDEVPEHYRELAVKLRNHRGFAGPGCCWGDQFIEDLSHGRILVRGQHKMRAVATCHHLTVVARECEPRETATAPAPVRTSRRRARPFQVTARQHA